MRKVDPALKSARDSFLAGVGFASADTSALEQNSAQMLSENLAVVGRGSAATDALSSALQGAASALGQAHRALQLAAQAAHAIDITIEVPDPEESEQGARW